MNRPLFHVRWPGSGTCKEVFASVFFQVGQILALASGPSGQGIKDRFASRFVNKMNRAINHHKINPARVVTTVGRYVITDFSYVLCRLVGVENPRYVVAVGCAK